MHKIRQHQIIALYISVFRLYRSVAKRRHIPDRTVAGIRWI